MSITISDKLIVNSGIVFEAVTLTTSNTLTDVDHIVHVEGSSITITLPSDAARTNGRLYYIHNSHASEDVTIGRNGANINGSASDLTLNAGDSITIYYNDTVTAGWFVI